MCECEPCPGLDVTDAPSVSGCGGEPFGSWQLTQVEWGRSQLELSVAGQAAGSCDIMTKQVGDQPPRVLMSLYEGGAAEYFSETSKTTVSWSESCVTSKVSQFGCGSKAWSGVSECKVDCDTCTCNSFSAASNVEQATWQRTQEALTLELFGRAMEFAYCVSGDKVELSAPGAYLVFERITKLAKPADCSDRTAMSCLAGEPQTCELGACTGGPSCEAAFSEGTCLTTSGCSWDAAACTGLAQAECHLADFGVVPGCELTNKPVTCQGTVLACDDRAGLCNGGCTLNDKGRCTGGPLQCESFLVCPFECDLEYDYSCSGGQFLCAGLNEYACEDTAEDYDGEACTWQPAFCEGTATPCKDVPTDECNLVPGCALAVAP
jgi:hypothetical protein